MNPLQFLDVSHPKTVRLSKTVGEVLKSILDLFQKNLIYDKLMERCPSAAHHLQALINDHNLWYQIVYVVNTGHLGKQWSKPVAMFLIYSAGHSISCGRSNFTYDTIGQLFGGGGTTMKNSSQKRQILSMLLETINEIFSRFVNGRMWGTIPSDLLTMFQSNKTSLLFLLKFSVNYHFLYFQVRAAKVSIILFTSWLTPTAPCGYTPEGTMSFMLCFTWGKGREVAILLTTPLLLAEQNLDMSVCDPFRTDTTLFE